MKKVLLADDEVEIQTLVEHMLEEAGFEVSCVNNGKEALEAINKDKFDLLILDTQMPILSGEQVLEEIYKQQNKDFKIILSSGRTLNLFELINEGEFFTIVDYVLNKPFKYPSLLAILQELELYE
jgi:CheY-like chemotaxis protein